MIPNSDTIVVVYATLSLTTQGFLVCASSATTTNSESGVQSYRRRLIMTGLSCTPPLSAAHNSLERSCNLPAMPDFLGLARVATDLWLSDEGIERTTAIAALGFAINRRNGVPTVLVGVFAGSGPVKLDWGARLCAQIVDEHG